MDEVKRLAAEEMKSSNRKWQTLMHGLAISISPASFGLTHGDHRPEMYFMMAIRCTLLILKKGITGILLIWQDLS